MHLVKETFLVYKDETLFPVEYRSILSIKIEKNFISVVEPKTSFDTMWHIID